jgi:hypothetical protein
MGRRASVAAADVAVVPVVAPVRAKRGRPPLARAVPIRQPARPAKQVRMPHRPMAMPRPVRSDVAAVAGVVARRVAAALQVPALRVARMPRVMARRRQSRSHAHHVRRALRGPTRPLLRGSLPQRSRLPRRSPRRLPRRRRACSAGSSGKTSNQVAGERSLVPRFSATFPPVAAGCGPSEGQACSQSSQLAVSSTA